MMKENIKVFLVALIIGMGVSYFYCYKYNNSMVSFAREAKVTAFYVGTYNTLDKASTKMNSYDNAIIYNTNGLYKVLIGVYAKSESIDLMTSYFLDEGISFQKEEIKINNEFLKASESYELLIKTSDEDYYDNLNNSILKLFNEYIN